MHGFVRAGLLAAAGGPESTANQIYFAHFLDNINVFVDGVPWSYSQQGNFTAAAWDVVGTSIDVTGPNPTFPTGKLIKRFLALHRKLIIFINNGQSNSVGTDANMDGVSDPTNPFTQIPPIPNQYYCFFGGMAPTQSGVASTAVTDIINSLNYALVLPAAVDINNLRDPPNAAFNQQEWCASFGQVVAASLPNDSAVMMIDVGHGGTSFTDDVQHAETVASVSWAANVITFVFNEQTNIGKNDTFIFQNATNSNYNATWTADVASDGITVQVTRIGDPGAYTGGGFALVWSAPMVNARNMIRRIVAQIAPALGFDPYFGGILYNGNEANDTLNASTTFISSQLVYLQAMAQQFVTMCGDGDSVIVWPQVGYPCASWQITDSSLFNCAPNTALGILLASQDPANKVITFGQYGAKAGGTGDVQAVPCIHYSVQGHCDHGEIGANLWLDYKASLDVTPLQLLNGEGVMVRVANSQNVATTFNKAAVIDTAMGIVDPGNSGYQFFTGVTNIAGNDGGNGLSEPVSSVNVSGTTFGLTTISAPTRSWGNFVGYGYNNAQQFSPPNNTQVQNFSWSATGGGQGTYTLVSSQSFAQGDQIVFAQMVPAGANIIPSAAALAGTGGTTVVMSMPVQPASATISTATWAAGIATYHTNAQVYTDGNTITASGSSRAGYNTTGVILSHTASSFTMAIVANPGGTGSGGTVHGGGNVANNGEYGVGRTQGLRGTVRQATFAHYSNNTGAPLLSGVAAIQLAQVDVYASTKSITAALTEMTL